MTTKITRSNYTIRLEKPDEASAVETLISKVFGPGMTARAAYALREGRAFERALAFVAETQDGNLIGSVRITKVLWGGAPVWMLGPLGVARAKAGCGIGSALMRTVMAACEEQAAATDINHVILVGDLAYYEPFGFVRVRAGSAPMPRPVDPSRILVCKLNGAEAHDPNGPVIRFDT